MRVWIAALAMLTACAKSNNELPPDIRARMEYMRVVGDVAEPACRLPRDSEERAARLTYLNWEHQTFLITCADDTVSVTLR